MLLPNLDMNCSGWEMTTITFIGMFMAPVEIEMLFIADIGPCLTNTIYVLAEINIRGVSVKGKIGMSIGISLTLNQMALYAINRNSR